jgi:signal transduction histidine kinase
MSAQQRPARRAALAAALIIGLLAGAFALTIWSYHSASADGRRALESRSDNVRVDRATAVFWHEREAMNQYLLTGDPAALAEARDRHAALDRTLGAISVDSVREGRLIARTRRANAALVRTFERALRERHPQRRAIDEVEALEPSVLAPLSATDRLNLATARQAVSASHRGERAALVAAGGGAAVALLAGLAFVFYVLTLIRRVDRQNERLRDLDSLKDSFVASVSHELRTPLTSIRGYLEIVVDGEAGDLTDEQRHFLRVVDRNAERLLRLVGDLLFVAQVDAGKLALERGPVELSELVEESTQSARPHADAKQIELVLDAQAVPTLDGDRARLAQLLDNLISNAIKFTPPGGRVTVSLAARGGTVALEVADNGMGIPAAEQERLFERFYRTRGAAAQAIQGTGLGLSIAQAIAQAHGGCIRVESEEGRGTTFCVELPLVEPARGGQRYEELVR